MHNSTILNHRIFGNGDPVVFLHGFLESTTMWDFLALEELGVQCVLIDLPGHGGSAALPETVSTQAMAERVIATLQELGISGYHLVGHSMGGYVALEIAKLEPEVRSVCLMNSSFWADSAEKQKDRNRLIEVVKRSKDLFLHEAIPGLFVNPSREAAYIDALIDEAKAMSVDAIVYATEAMRDRPDNEAIADQLGERLHLIQGEKDKVIPLELTAQKMAGKKAAWEVLPRVAHMSQVEAPSEVINVLRNFFQQIG
jgi:2-succinyl-6-hydroxy-2,4-cyclohexadiene-1-carboxylate synthase